MSRSVVKSFWGTQLDHFRSFASLSGSIEGNADLLGILQYAVVSIDPFTVIRSARDYRSSLEAHLDRHQLAPTAKFLGVHPIEQSVRGPLEEKGWKYQPVGDGSISLYVPPRMQE